MNDPIRITVEQPWLLPVRKHEGDAGADLKAKEMAEMLEALERIRDSSGPFNLGEMRKLGESAIRKVRGEE